LTPPLLEGDIVCGLFMFYIFAGVFRVLLIEKPCFMTLFCFLLLSSFFWGCGVLLFLFTLFAPYNIYSFRKVNTYINNKNSRGGGGV